MDVDGLFTGTWLGRKRPVPWSLSKKNISYEVFDFNITSYFTVNNFVINVGRRIFLDLPTPPGPPNSVPALFDGGSDGSGIMALGYMSLQGVTKKVSDQF